MINKNYERYSKILLILSWLATFAFATSFILILIHNQKLEFQLNSEGFNNFINIFSPSLKFGAIAIVIFTFWLTLERMRQTDERLKQTERQIKITEDNVKFNNYFKHNEQFSLFLKKLSFFKTIKNINNVDIDVLTMSLYNYFFNSDYKNFAPNLNATAKNEINRFISEIKTSSLSGKNQDLENVSIDEIKKLFSLINPTVNEICNIYIEYEVVDVREYSMTSGGQPIKLVEERYKLINNLYWTISLYEAFLAFDGVIQSEGENFSINFSTYRNDIGLQ